MKLLKFLFLLSFVFILTACTPPAYNDYSHNVDQADTQLNAEFKKPIVANFKTNPLVLNDHAASDSQPWLKKTVNIHAKDMPFAQVVKRVLMGSPATGSFDPTINQSLPVTVNFDGSRADALKILAAQTNYAYDIDGMLISWSTLTTKTFDVSFMPGSSKYQVGEASGGSAGGGSSSGSSSGPTTNLDSYGEFSSNQGDLSLWKDLDDTIKNMLSDKGKVNVSQSTTTITVTDRPENVQMIQDYLANMNQSLSRQVALDVQVLDISLDKEFNYGVDWGLVRSFMSGRYKVNFANQASNDLNTTLSPDGLSILELTATSGVWDGTNTLINALGQQGKVAVDTQPRVVTLNNQVAEIGINRQTTYLASVSTTTTANVGSTATLTPGEVTTGFTLYLLPKIQGDKVYLQISSTLSNLVTIKSYTGNTTGSTSENTSQIAAPIVDSKRFNQRSVVPTGATLVLAGFKQITNEANTQSVFGSSTLGGYGGNNNNRETIVLITPTILNQKG